VEVEEYNPTKRYGSNRKPLQPNSKDYVQPKTQAKPAPLPTVAEEKLLDDFLNSWFHELLLINV